MTCISITFINGEIKEYFFKNDRQVRIFLAKYKSYDSVYCLRFSRLRLSDNHLYYFWDLYDEFTLKIR